MVVEQIKLESYHAAECLDPGPHTARFPAGSAGSRLAKAEPACACDRSCLSFKQQQ